MTRTTARWAAHIILAATLTIACGCATSGPGGGGDLTPDALEDAVSTLVNAERASAGVPALALAPDVLAVARAHSTDMGERGYFSHDTPEGVSPSERATTAGIAWRMYGENIFYISGDGGVGTSELAACVVDGWMNSPGHRANILEPDYEEAAVGVHRTAQGAYYFTQNFLTRP